MHFKRSVKGHDEKFIVVSLMVKQVNSADGLKATHTKF